MKARAAGDQCDFFAPNTNDLLLAGVDEVGRGPLVGAVVTAAVILDPERPIAGLTDSKKLTAAQREGLATQIRERALAWALGRAEAAEIDTLNILQATMLAMQRAVAALPVTPTSVLIDRDGYIRFTIVGFEDGALPAYHEHIQMLLDEPPSD